MENTAKPRVSIIRRAARRAAIGVGKAIVFVTTFTLAGACVGAGGWLGIALAGWALQ